MRVKALIMLALASLIFLGAANMAQAEDLGWLSGLPGMNGTTVNDLTNATKNSGSATTSTGPGNMAMPTMLDWLCSSDGSSLPSLGGTVPEALLTGTPINDGMELATTGTTGLIVPDLAAQGQNVDTSINGILRQFTF